MADQQRERDIAEMEAQMAHDTDQYFQARPQIMRTRDKETTFEAGFKAAWAARPLSHAEGEASGPDYIMDALDNLVHDNYERSYRGAQNRQDDAELIRCALRRSHPAPQVETPIINAQFETVSNSVVGVTSAPVKRVEKRDDGSFTVFIDHWPKTQVAVPEALTKYDGYVPPEDGSAGEYYVDGWNSCRDALLANSAPAQTVSASVPEQKTWNQAGGREDLRYTEGWNDCRAAMLAAAPTAPAGELVTRCTAGLGCDEKGYCDAAATGQGDLCDRRTMAHEQPVSDPDGLPEPGRREAEQAYINGAFDYARDPIGSRDWVLFWNGWQARDKSAPSPDERDIAALLEQLYGTLERATPPADESPEEAVADAMALLSDFMERADKKGGKS